MSRRPASARARGFLNSFTRNNCLTLPASELTSNQATLIGHLVCSGDLVVRLLIAPTGACGIVAALPSAEIWSTCTRRDAAAGEAEGAS